MTVRPGDPIHIREMVPQDLEVVGEIDRLSFALPWPANAFRFELCENPNSRLWVAETSTGSGISQVIGTLVMWVIEDEVHISTLAVHPEHRRRGVARAMLTQALMESAQRGIVSATLEVRASNLAARALYQGFGFEIVGRRRRYYQDNKEDALIMTLQPIPKPPGRG